MPVNWQSEDLSRLVPGRVLCMKRQSLGMGNEIPAVQPESGRLKPMQNFTTRICTDWAQNMQNRRLGDLAALTAESGRP